MLVQTMWEGFLKGKSYREREQFTTFTYGFQQAHGGGGLLTGNTLKGRSYWQWLSTTETFSVFNEVADPQWKYPYSQF